MEDQLITDAREAVITAVDDVVDLLFETADKYNYDRYWFVDEFRRQFNSRIRDELD